MRDYSEKGREGERERERETACLSPKTCGKQLREEGFCCSFPNANGAPRRLLDKSNQINPREMNEIVNQIESEEGGGQIVPSGVRAS